MCLDKRETVKDLLFALLKPFQIKKRLPALSASFRQNFSVEVEIKLERSSSRDEMANVFE